MVKREAEELLLIEEADAWFEYLEATRAQSAIRYKEVEPCVGAPQSTAARSPSEAREAPPRSGGVAATAGRTASLWVMSFDLMLQRALRPDSSDDSARATYQGVFTCCDCSVGTSRPSTSAPPLRARRLPLTRP